MSVEKVYLNGYDIEKYERKAEEKVTLTVTLFTNGNLTRMDIIKAVFNAIEQNADIDGYVKSVRDNGTRQATGTLL